MRRARFGAGEDPDSLRLAAGPEAVRRAVERAGDAVEEEIERLTPAGAAARPAGPGPSCPRARRAALADAGCHPALRLPAPRRRAAGGAAGDARPAARGEADGTPGRASVAPSRNPVAGSGNDAPEVALHLCRGGTRRSPTWKTRSSRACSSPRRSHRRSTGCLRTSVFFDPVSEEYLPRAPRSIPEGRRRAGRARRWSPRRGTTPTRWPGWRGTRTRWSTPPTVAGSASESASSRLVRRWRKERMRAAVPRDRRGRTAKRRRRAARASCSRRSRSWTTPTTGWSPRAIRSSPVHGIDAGRLRRVCRRAAERQNRRRCWPRLREKPRRRRSSRSKRGTRRSSSSPSSARRRGTSSTTRSTTCCRTRSSPWRRSWTRCSSASTTSGSTSSAGRTGTRTGTTSTSSRASSRRRTATTGRTSPSPRTRRPTTRCACTCGRWAPCRCSTARARWRSPSASSRASG